MLLADRVEVVISGRVYSAIAYYVIGECRDHQGSVTPSALERHGLRPDDARAVFELYMRALASPLRCADPALWGGYRMPWESGAPAYEARFVREVW